MAFTTAQKAQIVKTYRRSKDDTGSSEVQVALLTARIQYLTEHLKIHQHDVHTRHGMIKLVNLRKKVLRYLKNKDRERYQTVVESLEIRG